MPTFVLSAMTKRHVKVALSGDGGDEVFGGYPKYLHDDASRPLPFSSAIHRVLKAVPWRPRGVGRFYPRTLSHEDRIRFLWCRYGDFPVFRKDMRQLLTADSQAAMQVEEYFEPWERIARRYGSRFDRDLLMRTDLETYLSENCLVKTDRASMLASLEVRVPYLDETILDRVLPLRGEPEDCGRSAEGAADAHCPASAAARSLGPAETRIHRTARRPSRNGVAAGSGGGAGMGRSEPRHVRLWLFATAPRDQHR